MVGKVAGPVFLCLQEPNGKISDCKPFSPYIIISLSALQNKIFKASNVVLSCSKSGKLSSTHVPYWLEQALLPHVPDKFLFLSDA